ncbi:MAG: DUF1987 domain-containing protein [Magnetococcales bacterium]|nr:DUF1987 domain-containing protein [Magnetococcales bacterium]NGZ27452.1 DUF1987 domain-containing protein [Magnetococcales bacterium]
MDNIKIARSERTPEIDFDFAANRFALRGESYPEDVPAFFGPPISSLETHLKGLTDGQVEFNFEMIYFNSTSAKVVMKLFDLLESVAGNGVAVVINWHFQADDDNMQELGEEFGEDLSAATFNMCPKG